MPPATAALHIIGDWGVVCAENRKSNSEALFAELRILSAYWTNRGVTPICSKYRRWK